jgi:hypothetical protein
VHRVPVVLVVLAAAASAAGCGSPTDARSSPVAAVSPAPEAPATVTLTPDGDDTYTVVGGAARTTVAAAGANRSGNTRVAWTAVDAPDALDEVSCATWEASPHGDAQQGALLRWDGVRGVTVTKNVWDRGYGIVNVHTWDLSRPVEDGRYTQIGGFPLAGITDAGAPGGARPLPWRLCAEARGAVVRFKVWALSAGAEPAWDDPCCTGSVPLPEADRARPGRPGWYAGHLPPGGAVAYADLAAHALG